MYGAKARYQDTQIAETYDKRFRSLPGQIGHALSMRALRRIVENYPKQSSFLDLPCGTGRLTMELASLGYKVVAADISSEMMAVAQRKDYRGNVVKWAQADAEHLPFENNEFDYLTSGRFLAHLPPEVRVNVLREFARVTRNHLIVGYHIKNALADFSRFVRTRGGVVAFELSRVSLHQAREEFRMAGLREIDMVPILPFLHDYHYFVLTTH